MSIATNIAHYSTKGRFQDWQLELCKPATEKLNDNVIAAVWFIVHASKQNFHGI